MDGAMDYRDLKADFKAWLRRNHPELADKESWGYGGYNDRQDQLDEYKKWIANGRRKP